MIERSRARGLLGLAACVVLTACASKADRIESGLKKGADFVRQSQWDKAGVEVRNVLQIDPKNARAYYLAGEIDDAKGEIRPAWIHYGKAIELSPSFVEAKVALARVYLLGGDVDDSQKQVDEVLALDPKNVRARVIQLALMARRGKSDAAAAQAHQLVDATPDLPADSTLLLAGLFVNAKQTDAALGLLDKAMTAAPTNVPIVEMSAELAAAHASEPGYLARAERDYQRATRQSPGDARLWRGWVAMHLRRSDPDRAEAVLRQAVADRPEDPARTLDLLNFLGAFRGAAVAEKAFVDAIAAHPKDTALRFALADFYTAHRRQGDTIRVLNEVVALAKDTPAGIEARGRLAAIDLATGDVAQARTLLAEVLKANPRDGAALVLQSRVKLNTGDAQGAIIDLRAAAKDRPGSVEITTLLSQAHRAAGETQLAREVLVDASKFKPEDASLHLLLANDSLQNKDFADAQSEIDQAVKLAPNDPRPAEMRVQLALSKGDMSGAEKSLLAFQSQFPKSPAGFLSLGRLYASLKRPDAALAQYDMATRLAPESAEPVTAAISILLSQHRLPQAEARIEALVAAQPKAAFARELRGELALVKGDYAAAEQAFRDEASLAPQSHSAYKNLASVKLAKHDLTGALAVLAEGHQAIPNDEQLELERADLLGNSGRVDEGIASYEALLKQFPKDDVVANNLASVLAGAKHDPASLNRALELAQRFEGSKIPGFIDTLGMVHYRLGHYDLALAQIRRALTLAPNDAMLQLHCGMAMVKSGDLQKGRDLLRKAIDSKQQLPDLAEARTLVAQG